MGDGLGEFTGNCAEDCQLHLIFKFCSVFALFCSYLCGIMHGMGLTIALFMLFD